MAFFRVDPQAQYRPRALKLSEIYHFTAKSQSVPYSVKTAVEKTLKNAGYDPDKINNIINNDVSIPVTEMRAIYDHLNKNNVYGFSATGKQTIDTYIRKETLKKQSIAELKLERSKEMRDDLEKNRLGSGPKKPGAPKIPPRIKLNF